MLQLQPETKVLLAYQRFTMPVGGGPAAPALPMLCSWARSSYARLLAFNLPRASPTGGV